MLITYQFGLPETLVSAIQNSPYNAVGDISTTRLLSPYQVVALQKRYAPVLSEDVSDMIYPLIGSNTHYIIERVNLPNTLKEWRFYLQMYGWLLSGQIDLWEAGVLYDWKVTSIWSYIYGLKPEHENQMNINAYMIRHSPYSDFLPIHKMQIVCIFRDWSKKKAETDRDYPQCQVGLIDVPIWDELKSYGYIFERINGHQGCESLDDEDLPECTPEERWEKPTTHAVMSKGRKSAHRVLNTMESAERWMEENGKGDYIDTRIGESTRCESYCSVRDFCHQYRTQIEGE